MATITTDTFLDDGTARTAGEGFTFSGAGGTLTIRTDTRWHVGAPASMTGSIGTIGSNYFSKLFIDGTKVRWLAFNSGTGNVPAIGTTVTQGGVSGYILGVWQGYTSAPTAVGAAMPGAGFIKFREVTGGSFTAGALSGIGASATAADVTGWIEIVLDQGSTMSGNVESRGSWFYLDDTTGSRGQTLQLPTNGGGSGTSVQAVQIETSPGSGVFEWYPALIAGTGWTNTSLALDRRSKFVQYLGNGQVRIGSDGTNDVGYLPPSGCKVRVPNIFGRSTTSASRSTNVAATTTLNSRARITTSAGRYLDLENVSYDWHLDVGNATVVNWQNCAFEIGHTITGALGPIVIANVCNGIPQVISTSALKINSCLQGTTASNVRLTVYNTATGLDFSGTSNFTGVNIHTTHTANRTSQGVGVNVTNGTNFSFTNLKTWGHIFYASGVSFLELDGIDYIDRMNGDTTSTGAVLGMFRLLNVSDSTFSNITFGDGGALTACNPYGPLINTSQCVRLKFRNAGTFASPLNCGASSTVYPAQILSGTNNVSDQDIYLQRIYLVGTRSGLVFTLGNTNQRYFLEHVYGTKSQALNFTGANCSFKGCGVSPATVTSISAPGTFFVDSFTSDTSGAIQFLMSAPTAETAAHFTQSIASIGGFDGTLNLRLVNSGDYVIIESPYFIKGHTGFQNAVPGLSGLSNNLSISFDVDNGSGYSGVWKVATSMNLSAQTVNDAGFKMKIKITCIAPNTSSTLNRINFLTTSTATSQGTNLYPLDTVTLSFEGLVPGSEVRAYVGTDPATAVEIGGTESSGETFSFTHSASGQEGYIMVFAMGYQPVMIPRTYAYEDSTLLIQQVVDRNYVNP